MPKIIEPWQFVVETIAQEASSEPIEGMIVVAEVIRDRAATKYNSDGTIIGTVLRPSQFSGWNTNDPNRIRVANYEMDHPAIVKAIAAYRAAFEGRTNLARGANLYHADWMEVYPEWTKHPNVQRVGQVGRHILYKETR